MAHYGRSLSSGPLIHRPPVRTWLTSIDEKLRAIYAAITCSRASDVADHHAPQRPPRSRVPPPHRGEPRPRLIPPTTPIPPSPDQAGGSAWQQQTSFEYRQQSPGTSYGLRPNVQPHGMFLFNNVHFDIFISTYVFCMQDSTDISSICTKAHGRVSLRMILRTWRK